jgi:hypothetical protein
MSHPKTKSLPSSKESANTFRTVALVIAGVVAGLLFELFTLAFMSSVRRFLAAGNVLSCSSVMYTYKGNSITYNLLYRRWLRLFICRPIGIITAVLLDNHCHIGIKKLTKFVGLLNNPFFLFLILLDLRFKSSIAMVKAGGVLNLRASPGEPRLESLVWS